ncbi:PTS system mannose/fructose/sorbose family transporter subunit IID [Clostridium sp. AM58-1XD]|uniref:PTS system mannose/fructose/sorbose family transporter subunit IID n=1 Tax=Clostridium sp. AM58-1XD TaxID=2292307 RepID=UPI000E4F08A9|nr:PTS system mannose/fructose/sorbose family transporter subunit IID [Clostridium sp. AM58-1XD]RGZ01590.1 PTS system mannose/fructose/sorbose family transporter subunit IID [Clostridium sp. AM58-1XD]
MEENVKIISSEPLTQKELKGLFWRYNLFYSFCINFENWHGCGYAYDMIPLLKKYYNKEGQKRGMQRHMDFHNNEHTTANIVWGVMVGMEEQKALGYHVEEDMIRTTKSALMGPVAGIGDSLVQATILPLLLSIAISLTGESYSPLGTIFYLIASGLILFSYGYFLFKQGYRFGRNAVTMLAGGNLKKIQEAVQLFGVIVIGALSANYVKFKTALAFTAAKGADPTKIQDILDGIFPNMLSLFLVLFSYYLVSKKKMSMVKLILILGAATILFALAGVM